MDPAELTRITVRLFNRLVFKYGGTLPKKSSGDVVSTLVLTGENLTLSIHPWRRTSRPEKMVYFSISSTRCRVPVLSIWLDDEATTRISVVSGPTALKGKEFSFLLTLQGEVLEVFDDHPFLFPENEFGKWIDLCGHTTLLLMRGN